MLAAGDDGRLHRRGISARLLHRGRPGPVQEHRPDARDHPVLDEPADPDVCVADHLRCREPARPRGGGAPPRRSRHRHSIRATFAVYVGMLCAFLPFLVLPLYTAVEKLDWSIAEAAADLGADGPRVFRHAVLPQVAPGLAAGIILVFIPATGTVRDPGSPRGREDRAPRQRHPAAVRPEPRLALRVGGRLRRDGGRPGGPVALREGRGRARARRSCCEAALAPALALRRGHLRLSLRADPGRRRLFLQRLEAADPTGAASRPAGTRSSRPTARSSSRRRTRSCSRS